MFIISLFCLLTTPKLCRNLSPNLKTHAVTMFEVGKLNNESMDAFIEELSKVEKNTAEGEARRYFEHAITLKNTLVTLRGFSI
jgi:hypothetical protein